jgi:hypothetical protein
MELISTPVYAVHVQIIRGWWPEAARSDGFRLLGGASRCADVLSKLAFGTLVSTMPWQRVTWLAAGIGWAAALLGGSCHRDSREERRVVQPEPLRPAQVYQILRRFFGEPLFWLCACQYLLVTVVKRTNELLIALYWADVGGVSDGQAGRLAAVWSAGVAVSVLAGGWVFGRLGVSGRSREQRLLVGGLLATSAGKQASPVDTPSTLAIYT